MPKKRIKHWVLKAGKFYFREWTSIGPRGTRRSEEAARFHTKKEAMMSPAFSFSMTFYEPHPIRRK